MMELTTVPVSLLYRKHQMFPEYLVWLNKDCFFLILLLAVSLLVYYSIELWVEQYRISFGSITLLSSH
jgi:hypothetical protein